MKNEPRRAQVKKIQMMMRTTATKVAFAKLRLRCFLAAITALPGSPSC